MTHYATVAEQISVSFLAWEIRGRGWQLADHPCELEPPFRPFFILPGTTGSRDIDDGKRHTLLSAVSSLVTSPFTRTGRSPSTESEVFVEPVPWPQHNTHSPRTTLAIRVPTDFKSVAATTQQLLLALGASIEPVSFELIGQDGKVTIQLTAHADDEQHVTGLVRSFCPQVVISRSNDLLPECWTQSAHRMVIDFGLSDEFFLPIQSDLGRDAYLSLFPALASAGKDELLTVQIMFQRVRNRWEREIVEAVGESESDCIYSDAPHFVRLAKEKTATPLFAVSLRLGIASTQQDRLRALGRGVMPFMRSLDRPGSNELIPLENDDYPDAEHEAAFIGRYGFRTGMLLSLGELAQLAHFPDASVTSEALIRDTKRTRAATHNPSSAETILGISRHGSNSAFVHVGTEARLAHTHVVGASGTGKSTLLRHLALQDIEAGRGVAILDPAGDLVDDVARSIPQSRINDVIYFDPSDTEYPIGLGLLEAQNEIEKITLADDITAIFERLSTSWGDTMTTVLANAIMAVLEHENGGTLLDVRRMLIDDDFRKAFVARVQDEEVRFFWQKQYPTIGSRSVGPILSRLDTFLRPKTIRNIVAVQHGRISIADALRDGKILLAKLSQGLIGEQNSFLLGSLLLAKIQQAAMARQAIAKQDRTPYFLYIDEAQNFVTPSLNALLNGTRKYGLGGILAHQHLAQLEAVPLFKKALLGNAHTRIVFRVGEDDARDLDRGFGHFEANDLLNLGRGEAIGRMGEAANDFTLKTIVTSENATGDDHIDAMREASRRHYASKVVAIPSVPAALDLQPPAPFAEQKPVEAMPASATTIKAATLRPFKRDDGRTVTFSDEPDDGGKGGREHKYIQHLIKRLGEDRGYRASVEQTVEGGRVDIVLSKNSTSLAFEISVTNTASYELTNIEKCLKASFTHIFFICGDVKRRDKVRQLLEVNHQNHMVRFLAPEDVVGAIDELAQPEAPASTVVRGYRVKVNRQTVSSNEFAGKRAVIAEVIAKSMMR